MIVILSCVLLSTDNKTGCKKVGVVVQVATSTCFIAFAVDAVV